MITPSDPMPGLVASETRESAEAGATLLSAGGNAIDAAVAAAIAETIVSPHNAGIVGFAGTMLVHLAARRETFSIRFDTVAPKSATPDMFVGRREQHRAGPLSVGVPGVLRGLETAVKRFGKRPWAEVVAPAQHLAAEGFSIGPVAASMIAAYRDRLRDFPETAACVMPGGHAPAKGDWMKFPDLAASLGVIAAQGADAFYQGELGERTVRHLQEQGGILTREDLAAYTPEIGPPLAMQLGDDQFLTPALPGGGISVLQSLRVLSHLPAPSQARPGNDPDYLHHLIQTLKLVWRDRLTHMADPAYMSMPPEAFLSDAHAAALAKQILNGEVPDDFVVPADFSCTSHVTASDSEGNLATVTYTHGFAFGSMVTAPGTGLTLGHGMARFDGEPGRPNSVAPGKKALHNMAPMIVLRRGHPFLALGWTGGRRIPNVVTQVVANLTRFGLPLQEALAAPNLHSEGAEPIKAERAFPAGTLETLRQRGHRIEFLDHVIGFGSAIQWDAARGLASGATDPRRNGVVATV